MGLSVYPPMASETRINQILNYTYMETALNCFKRYLDFTINFYDYRPVFENGKKGQLFFPPDFECKPVDALVEWTKIDRAIWTGEQRVMTGFRYNDPAAAWEPGFIPLDKLTYSDYKDANDFPFFEDPLGLDFLVEKADDAFQYSLDNVIAIAIYRLYKEKELREIASGTERQNRAMGEQRKSWDELAPLLPYMEFGPDLADLIKKLAAALPK